jgi:hypothetical protein
MGHRKARTFGPGFIRLLETASFLFFYDTYIALIVGIVKVQLLFLESIADPSFCPPTVQWAGTGLESIPEMID